MIRSGTAGWQTTMADLSLILFMVALAALVQQADKDPALLNRSGMPENAVNGSAAPLASSSAAPLPAEAEAVAIYRPSNQAPDIAVWLDQHGKDPRLRVTILARYTEAGGAAAVTPAAMALAQEAHNAGYPPRIVLEPSLSNDVAAVLSYDRAETG